MTAPTIASPTKPATATDALAEQAFAGISCIGGSPVIALMLQSLTTLGQTWSGNQPLTTRQIDEAADKTAIVQATFLELMRLLQIGITREQLMAMCQWCAKEGVKVNGQYAAMKRDLIAWEQEGARMLAEDGVELEVEMTTPEIDRPLIDWTK